MSAVCAACLGNITNGEQFRLVGTEVFHRVCAAQIGTHESAGNKQRRQLAELERRIAARDTTIVTQRGQLEQLQRQLLELRVREHATAQRAQQANDALDNIRDRAAEMQATIDQRTSERDKARQDLALSLLPPLKEKAHDPRDDGEIRFSLLEIDGDPPKK